MTYTINDITPLENQRAVFGAQKQSSFLKTDEFTKIFMNRMFTAALPNASVAKKTNSTKPVAKYPDLWPQVRRIEREMQKDATRKICSQDLLHLIFLSSDADSMFQAERRLIMDLVDPQKELSKYLETGKLKDVPGAVKKRVTTETLKIYLKFVKLGTKNISVKKLQDFYNTYSAVARIKLIFNKKTGKVEDLNFNPGSIKYGLKEDDAIFLNSYFEEISEAKIKMTEDESYSIPYLEYTYTNKLGEKQKRSIKEGKLSVASKEYRKLYSATKKYTIEIDSKFNENEFRFRNAYGVGNEVDDTTFKNIDNLIKQIDTGLLKSISAEKLFTFINQNFNSGNHDYDISKRIDIITRLLNSKKYATVFTPLAKYIFAQFIDQREKFLLENYSMPDLLKGNYSITETTWMDKFSSYLSNKIASISQNYNDKILGIEIEKLKENLSYQENKKISRGQLAYLILKAKDSDSNWSNERQDIINFYNYVEELGSVRLTQGAKECYADFFTELNIGISSQKIQDFFDEQNNKNCVKLVVDHKTQDIKGIQLDPNQEFIEDDAFYLAGALDVKWVNLYENHYTDNYEIVLLKDFYSYNGFSGYQAHRLLNNGLISSEFVSYDPEIDPDQLQLFAAKNKPYISLEDFKTFISSRSLRDDFFVDVSATLQISHLRDKLNDVTEMISAKEIADALYLATKDGDGHLRKELKLWQDFMADSALASRLTDKAHACYDFFMQRTSEGSISVKDIENIYQEMLELI